MERKRIHTQPRTRKRIFFIKKRIEADDAVQALRLERSATVTDVWTEEVNVSAVGFQLHRFED